MTRDLEKAQGKEEARKKKEDELRRRKNGKENA